MYKHLAEYVCDSIPATESHNRSGVSPHVQRSRIYEIYSYKSDKARPISYDLDLLYTLYRVVAVVGSDTRNVLRSSNTPQDVNVIVLSDNSNTTNSKGGFL